MMSEVPGRILLIEDAEAEAAFTRRTLEASGYAVALEPDIERGLLAARKDLPRMVLVGARRPGLDCWEAARRLKHDPLTARVPVVVLATLPVTQHRLTTSRCDAALQKPFTSEALLAQVAALLAL